MSDEEAVIESEEDSPPIFEPNDKGFFSLLGESFKFFLLHLPAIATIVVPVFLVVEFLVPLLSNFIPDLAEDMTGVGFLDDILSEIIRIIIVALIGSIIGGIAWIATIRVIASSIRGEKIPPVQAMKDGMEMLPMFVVTAILYYLIVIIGFIFLIVPGIILWIYLIFWQFSYVLRGKGAFSALTYSKDLVSGNFVRVALNVIGISIVMYVLNTYVIGLIAGTIAGLVGEEDSIPYLLVDTIFTALGKVFEGVRIIFMLSLFKDLEKD
ncbi:MAG: hypothetical protein BEU00_01265 [Marine Group III euryarchaeote CG-Epi3]|jgi:hypothetical protein|uniref:DUF7847 domain-containing protein n=1 Tax=Marine Group III euryarchaeote CG-Epi3 TaxID=1888997 RepID=A0A1J5TRX6_9ARCH|nr:MAG: hypothetical protein BEU00_01265 [Marine Group III euryarchaeote CG-Epi3]|tara:strand:- start:6436 stop:7236 length:801 start_codon:yes stop_codon:yes gene_type:complete